jgi:hypothetical protein
MQLLCERVEAAWSNIFGLACMLGFINSTVRSDPSLEDRVIIRIRDRCAASYMV